MKYEVNIDFSNRSSHSLILERIMPNSKVLEFGPASGYMTQYMKNELNCFINCVEVDSEAANLAKKYCDKMIVADLDDMTWVKELGAERFDYILFADVLEHLRDPWKVLKVATEFLSSNGKVITSIPNISHNAIIMNLIQGKFNYNKTGLLDDTHIRFFARDSVINLFRSAELMPVEWLATMLKPEHTEFKQSYEDFPDSLKEYLVNRQDGDVYQFVTVSQKGELELSNLSELLSYKENYMDDYYIQAFWEGEDGFSEKYSAKSRLFLNNDFTEYTLKVPCSTKGKFRIDPTNFPGDIEISEIKVYGEEDIPENLLFESSCRNDFEGLHLSNGAICLKLSDTYEIVNINDDPQIIININNINYNWLYIKVNMKVTEGINIVYEKMNQAIKEFKDENKNLQNELKSKNDEINDFINQNKELIKEIATWQLDSTSKQEEIEDLKDSIVRNNELTNSKTKQIVDLKENLNDTKKQLECLQTENNMVKIELEKINNQINSILSSRSWRYTSFLRKK